MLPVSKRNVTVNFLASKHAVQVKFKLSPNLLPESQQNGSGLENRSAKCAWQVSCCYVRSWAIMLDKWLEIRASMSGLSFKCKQ